LLVREEVLLAGLCERKILFRLKIYDRLRQATAKRTGCLIFETWELYSLSFGSCLSFPMLIAKLNLQDDLAFGHVTISSPRMMQCYESLV